MKNSILVYIGLAVIFSAIGLGFALIPADDKSIYESSLLGSFHLLTLAVGLSGVFLRGIYLRNDLSQNENLKRLFAADNAWGIGALLWIVTGLLRAFGGFEKGTDFYLHNPMFHLKMGLFAFVFILELWPMITFIRWRILVAKEQPINYANQKTLANISFAETLLTILIVFVAGFMARGIWG